MLLTNLEELFIHSATRTARWMSSVSPDEITEPGDVAALGSVFSEALRTALHMP